jgi:flagellar biogenesis protein FliO
MTNQNRSAASDRPMARRIEVRRGGSGRRAMAIMGIAALAAVALIGVFHPLAAAGGAQPSATDALTASGVGTAWNTGDATGGINWLDLITKGTIVLVLLFITLRVLGRFGTGATKRGGLMQVLESKTLAPKASLHLVAIGERRLVVGLTPSGMVSLAELDAAELESTEAEAATADGRPADASGFAPSAGVAQPSFAAALNSVMRPVDAITGRLVLFINGGRVR